ncbi:carbamoyl-phosphate synthase [Bacillus sp. S0635]|uniref:phage tail protein n=1 Tax=Bacillus TaxID=1386 RepID=UPI00209DA5CF|nr:carbamoyl-phosphate synthase [Bacillus sp. S0635]MCP1285376.1 carbamoyl-phosphate synthase [Bacillus sp. S0635]
MADGQVIIDVGLNSAGVARDVQQVNRELGRVGSNMGRVSRDIRNTMGSEFANLNRDISRGYANISQESQNMMYEMKNAYKTQKQGMGEVYDAQIKAQYGYFQLAQSQGQYTGTMDDLLGRINEIGKAEKKAKDQAINNNKFAMMSIYQTIGYLNNASSTASRFQNNLTTMNNPLYNTSRLALTAVDSLDRLARSGSPQQLALEFLGANASVKQYNDFIRDLGTQMMAMPIIFGLATVGAIKFYGALHGKVMEENTQYAEAFNNMMEKLTKVFEPMRQAFAAVMIPLYNFVAKIADLVIAFNEAHPTIAKFIQGMMMLVPALMVVLTPLALGIGYFKGLRAILFALRPIMMPIITGFAMMSAPAWILAGAITGLVMVFTHLWKTNEGFKNSIMSAIGVVSQFGQTMLALGKYLFWTAVDGDHLNDWITHLPEPFQATAEKVGQAIVKIRESCIVAGQAVLSFGQNVLSMGKYLFWTAVDGDYLNDWITHLPVGFQDTAQKMGESVANMRATIVSMFPVIGQFGTNFMNLGRYLLEVVTTGNLMNGFLSTLSGSFQNVALFLGTAIEQMKASISNFVEAVKMAMGGDTSALGQIFMTILPTLIALLLGGFPALLITASKFLPTIVEGINSMMPFLTNAITNIITSIVSLITTYLPQFLMQGIEILSKIIEGIVQVLPQVITTMVQVGTEMINSFITVIGTLLPVVLDAGIKILMAVIDGIVKSLPAIIDACLKVMDTLVNSLVNLLPKIIDAGIKILMALIDGILKILPRLIDTAIMLVTKLCDMILQNLPKILDAGIKILMALIDGILKILPQLIQAGIKIIVELVNILIDNLPKLLQAGVKILTELIRGIISILPQLISTGIKLILEIAKAIISNLPQILSAGAKILLELIKGIVSLVGQLISTITSKVIGGITKCFSNAGTMLLDIGKNIIQGLINGITGMVGKAVSAVKKVASNIKDGIADFFDIHSPSRLMKKDGRFIIEGIMVGMFDMAKSAVKSAKSVAEQIYDGFAILADDVPMGDIDGSASKFILPSASEFASGAVQSSTMVESSKAIRQAQAIKKQQDHDEKQQQQAPTYIIMDKKIVGEAITPEVEKTQERRNSRYAQFTPKVAPTY